MRYLTQINIPAPDSFSDFKFKDAGGSPFFNLNLLGDITGRLLTFAILGAGLFFFVRLISAGYQFLTSAGDSGKVQGATKELTNAAIGLVIVISSYLVAQVIDIVFGVNILGYG